MTTKQVRWRCPQCAQGVLAPSRPRRNDTRRYCLDCSKNSPKLVERVPVALEAKRKERKRSQAKRAAKKRGFKRPSDYYKIAGMEIRFRLKVIPDHAVRVRETKGPGPITIKNNLVHFRKGPWADRFDVEAQAIVADARWCQDSRLSNGGVIPKARPRSVRISSLRQRVRAAVVTNYGNSGTSLLAGWRPMGLSRFEVTLAEVLRKNAAVKLLQESSEIMERVG